MAGQRLQLAVTQTSVKRKHYGMELSVFMRRVASFKRVTYRPCTPPLPGAIHGMRKHTQRNIMSLLNAHGGMGSRSRDFYDY